jgi:hypothetical protein
LLPIFDPDKTCSPKDHIKNFYLAVWLLYVQHEDVVCSIFSCTFDNKASTWYYNIPVGSIRNWETFEKDFINKSGEEKTPTKLFKELVSLKMDSILANCFFGN